MKEVTREKTVTEVMYYEAVDGMRFDCKDACLEYEKSAKCVMEKELLPYRVGETNEYYLYGGIGSEEYGIDIYKIENDSVLTKLNIYRTMLDKTASLIPTEYINKIILLHWDYDHRYSWFDTIDELCASIRKDYEKLITPKEEEKKDN